MIEIVDAYTRSGNEWCTCCQKQTNTKRIKFSYDGRQGNSVVLCDDCRRELARTVKAIPLDKVKEVREKIFKNVYEYSGSGDETLQAYCDGFKKSLEIIDKLIESEGK